MPGATPRARAGTRRRARRDAGAAEAPRLRVLIVEDEVLIALELEDLVAQAGHESVGIAASSDEAVRLGRELAPDLALVDIHLSDGPTGVEAARLLGAAGRTTVVFATANLKRIPPDFAGAHGAIGKPYSERSVRSALGYFAARRGDEAGPGAPPPDGIVLAPRLRQAGA